MAKYGVYPRDKEGTVQGVEMAPEQHVEYKQVMHKLGANKRLNELVNLTEYRMANDETRKRAIERLLGKLKRTAKGILLRQNKGLRSSVIDRKRKLIKQFTTNSKYSSMLTANDLSDIRGYLENNNNGKD